MARILFVSTLYPSSTAPGLAPYNRQLIAALAQRAEMRVIAPVAWFPGRRALQRRALPPCSETFDGIPVTHPRVFYTPGILIHRHWVFYQRSIRGHLKQAIDTFRPDHVIIGFAYPDGAAVAPLCRASGVPYSIRVNGSDFRVRVRDHRFKATVMDLLQDAPLVFCPGGALKRDMAAAGVDEGKIVPFNNGVDTSRFCYRAGAEREDFAGAGNSGGDIVLFVGHLADVKGPDILLRAWHCLRERGASNGSQATNARLLFIGDGPMRRTLTRLAGKLGVAGSVGFLGSRPHEEMSSWMNTAACLCLTSRSEGMPNVVVEALASGTPVVATNVGEVPSLVRDDVNGYVVTVEGKDLPGRLADALTRALDRDWDRRGIASGMQEYTWENAAATILGAVTGGQEE